MNGSANATSSTAWYPAYYSGKAAVSAAMPKTAAATPAPVATAAAPADAATLVAGPTAPGFRTELRLPLILT